MKISVIKPCCWTIDCPSLSAFERLSWQLSRIFAASWIRPVRRPTELVDEPVSPAPGPSARAYWALWFSSLILLMTSERSDSESITSSPYGAVLENMKCLSSRVQKSSKYCRLGYSEMSLKLLLRSLRVLESGFKASVATAFLVEQRAQKVVWNCSRTVS